MGTPDKNSSVTDLDTPATGDHAEQTSKAAVANKPAAQAKAAAKATEGAAQSNGEKKFEISISSTDSDSTPVKVGVNGLMTVIPRNTRVVVSKAVKDVLDNAVVEVITQEGGKTITTSAPRYPMSVFGVVDAE